MKAIEIRVPSVGEDFAELTAVKVLKKTGDRVEKEETFFRNRDSEVEIHKDGKEVYNGIASHIVDDGFTLSFKDKDGNQQTHKYRTMSTCTYA